MPPNAPVRHSSISHPYALSTDIDYFRNQPTENFSNSTYNTYSHLLQQPHNLLETFDPGFPLPNTEGIGLLPTPVAYEVRLGFSEPDSNSGINVLPLPPTLPTLPTPTSLSSSSSLGSSHQNFIQDPSSSSGFPYYAPCLPPTSSYHQSNLPSSMSNYQPQTDGSSSSNQQDHYPIPTPKLATPPPLFDPSEQDLFSSFLNILGDFNGEWDFDPQGMPEDMPVLGELKRRLEADSSTFAPSTRRGSEEMGQEVKNRLNINDPEPVLPTLSNSSVSQTRNFTTSLDRPSEGKKAKLKAGPNTLYPLPPDPCLGTYQPLTGSNRQTNDDIEMIQARESNDWPSTSSQFVQRLPPITNSITTTDPIDGSRQQSKLSKNTHIVSEQRRRNAIQGGFGNLVNILRAGELASGISISVALTESQTKGGKNKATGRGRGRRGEIETGASKSVVLERAVEYVKWMRAGNLALKAEVERVETLARSLEGSR
ncbi:hypothetical protein CROQUDRAFT_96491 [Cronartium quercuum f. sp. fusiforme G11]|uniref:BHLH domain-containing protein n=1 Tax=Cronartium quercuum f. sp. fusiforme G11 TaxID=708437 RepID=A0A9P6T982_9BASI|nr:hypothetical protein CROQUDRAFT_96491 [Cronartium quercuum f. sp. fusiforme G11]